MLNIKYDATRKYEDGQYFVELVIIDPTDSSHVDRLGYWCDKAHLNVAIFSPVIEAIKNALVDWS